jgi:putative colanic acid polymerase
MTFSMYTLMHLVMFSVFEYEVTVLNILIFIWIFKNYHINIKFSTRSTLLLSTLIFLPLINIDLSIEFFKSYALYIQSLFIVFIVFTCKPRKIVHIESILKSVRYIQIIVAIFAILQFFLFDYFGSDILYNPWGSHQFNKAYDPSMYANARSVGFYLEPSFLALVSLSLFFSRHILDRRVTLGNLTVTCLIILASESSFGSLVFILLTLFICRKLAFRFSLYLTFAIALIVLCVVLIDLDYVMTFDLFRLNELANQDSSGYWRLVAPLVFFENNLIALLSGFPFGSMEKNLDSYFLFDRDYGKWQGTAIDNGIYVLIYYFGLLSLALFSWVAILFVKTKSEYIRRYVVFYALSITATGAIFSIDIIFLLVVFPCYVMSILNQNRNRE